MNSKPRNYERDMEHLARWRPGSVWRNRQGALDLWWIDWGGEVDDSAAFRRLSGAEKVRCERLRVASKRRQFLWSRAALRYILGRTLGRAPLALEISVGDQGKPSLEGGPAFNLSHSGELAVVGVYSGSGDLESGRSCGPLARLGVDVERIRSNRPLDRMARRFFSAAESDAHEAVAANQRLEDFYRRWALKEAYVKALGVGLTYSSRAFRLRDDEPTWTGRKLLVSCQRYQTETEGWLFHNGWLESNDHKWALAICVDRELDLRFFRCRASDCVREGSTGTG